MHKLGNHQVDKFLQHKPPIFNSRWFGIFQRQIHNVPFEGLSLTIPTTPREIVFPLQDTLPKLVLHQQPQNSNMLCFNMFKRKICSILLKDYHELFESQPQKFCYAKVVHTALPKKILDHQPPNSSMLCTGMLNPIKHLYCSPQRPPLRIWKGTPKTNCFPKAVHTKPCPSKHFTISHQISVCCAFVCLD